MLCVDQHIHSSFSIDAFDGLEAVCQASLDRGLQCICITDHYDLLEEDPGYKYMQIETYLAAVEAMREKYAGRLCILTGLEFGEPHLFPRELAQIATLDLDMIIGGVHCVESCFLDDKKVQELYSPEEIFTKYYTGVLAAVEAGGFQVLAHLDLPKRYLGVSVVENPLTDKILATLVEKGIALEINTSPLRMGQNESSPGYDLLKKYTNLGGVRVTVGSDAHAACHIGSEFDYAAGLLARVRGATLGYFKGQRFFPWRQPRQPR